MKKSICIFAFCAALFLPGSGYAQVDEGLKADIIRSGYIHKPLPVREDKAVETTFGPNKTIIRSEVLCDMESLDGWSHQGYGTISLTSERSKDGGKSLRLEAPSMPEKFLGWGLGRGTCQATFDIGGKDWRGYNRLRFSVYPECEGARTTYLNLYVESDGEVKVPDRFGREGYHELNLKNNQWNDCYIEMPALARDKVTCIKFAIEIFGRELTMGETLRFDVDNVLLEEVEEPEVALGWQPHSNRVIFSTSGYTTEAQKTALVTVDKSIKNFNIVDYKTGNYVYTGRIKDEKTRLGDFRTIDFSALKTPGQYVIKVGDITTWPFYINDDVWEDSAWRVLNFLFCERCGYPVPGIHGICHADLHAVYNGKIYPLNGGWHDAGDMSQSFMQSGEICYGLFQMAQNAKKKGKLELYNRLVEEALWGMDLVLRSRFGDGYRAAHWGTNLWTDGYIGSEDDSGRREISVSNSYIANFTLAGIEAYGAMTLADEEDVEYTGFLRKAAIEDFGWAVEEFEKRIAPTDDVGHSRGTAQSQNYANASWAASMLYQLTGDKKYAEYAAEYVKPVLESQRTAPLKGFEGFFYRDPSHREIVHFNHQSRDFQFIEAIASLIETQPLHPDYGKWMAAIKLYGKYLKKTTQYIQPYGMVPSGVYNVGEVNEPGFYSWQTGIRSGAEQDYAEQLRNGYKIDDEHYLRMFPVWFSFKGNHAVGLSTAKNAAICARLLGDKELKNIAERELAWIVGFNPFGQSTIYGEGSNWCQIYNALPGETVGEIPVGIQAYYNGDEPYWPQFNTATYKEVWGASATRWLMLVSEF